MLYTITADSVYITNTCDTAELIIENHTQHLPGFLFNKGRGRTEFRRILQKINDTLYLAGGDSLKLPNAWVQGGNAWNSTGIFGTRDNNPIDFYSNNIKRGSLTNNGNWIIGTGADNGYKMQVTGNGSININPNLSRPNDMIIIGGRFNTDDGQNVLIGTSNGTTSYPILMERDGFIGMGSGSPISYNVGFPTFRISRNGNVAVTTQYLFFGDFGGPYNSSHLLTYVSNVNEWQYGDRYPSGQNYYYFGTQLGGALPGYVRAPLRISGRNLQFLTGASPDIEAVRISESQNLLVGTDKDHGEKLQVNGTSRFTDTVNVCGRFIQGYTQESQFGNSILFNIYNNYSRIQSPNTLFYQSDAGGDQHIFANWIGTQFKGTLVTLRPGGDPAFPDNQLSLKVYGRGATLGLTVNMAGRVGIGTETAEAQLHTTGTVRFAGLTNNETLTRVIVADANGNLYYRNQNSWAANGIMNSDLAVNGSISAQKMHISQTGNWPDYVFSKQYHLPSLTELEQFIKQNNHLPGVPSAAEVEKKGIDVGDNQAVLLKKIEELTLYVIDQDKKLQQQSEEITELKNQNKELEALKKQMMELKTLISGKK